MDGHPIETRRLEGRPRWLLLLLSAGLLGILVLARGLEPDPRGYGTHTQLGLGPCAFRELTGRPCPTCGMTTAFAWLSRGDPGRSWGANPAGCVIALLAAPVATWLLACVWLGRPIGTPRIGEALMRLAVAVVVLGVICWSIRVLGAPVPPGIPGPPPAGFR
ncbi:hypothetical protein OJF2_50070 [Aquisphaera giovannonii]|uniref:DUF2752 domain-containing protein n=1 Tax=Aquisphaera giovannonii TaxID=406548 RepID=A0A5B9W7B8_9BACT|nr:DUF2752 domain-containing protein [Aquisphaera giovannonii]QEH36443.1 hypothetical protein OJF2_50070 [Aquisphaera giovannonii]